MDIIGTESIYAEADLMAAIATMLRKFGLKDGEFAIGVSSRKLLATYLEEIGAPNPSLVYPVLDRRLKIGPEAFAKALADAGLSEDQVKKLDDFMSCKSIEEVKAKVHSENATAALQEIEDLFATLTAAGYGECVNLDLSIVRGLAYYTGIVFEVFDKGKSMRAIAGGGRYDSLTEKLGGERIPGVGFGMGDVVLADLLAEHKLLPSPKQSVDFYIASFTNDMKKVFETAQVFRADGSKVSHPLAAMKMGKQLDQANDQANYQGAKIVVYVDGSKAAEGEFEYKDMRTGEMFVGNVAAIIDRL
jgi:histidyl-tRNA synthetase